MKKISVFLLIVGTLAILFAAKGGFALAEESESVRLETHTLDETKKTRVRVSGRTSPGATVKMYVNGNDQGKVNVGRKGKISKWVVLDVIGANEILITAELGENSASVTRNVLRKATRAVDMPLALGRIHCDNTIKKSTLVFWGRAYGVSRVEILVDDEEWGWSVVNTKTGKYSEKVRLEDGVNEIKVRAEKDGEWVTVTKNVIKI